MLVDTTDVISLYETSRAPQLYVRREAVRMDLLVAQCDGHLLPVQGLGVALDAPWSMERCAPDVAWSYDDPLPESAPIAACSASIPSARRWFRTF